MASYTTNTICVLWKTTQVIPSTCSAAASSQRCLSTHPLKEPFNLVRLEVVRNVGQFDQSVSGYWRGLGEEGSIGGGGGGVGTSKGKIRQS